MSVFLAVEDQLSGSVMTRLIRTCLGEGVEMIELGKRHGGHGHMKAHLRQYVELSGRESVIVLTDLDKRECAPTLRREWLDASRIPEPLPDGLAFCVAVREVETWLMADRDNFARFLHVSPDVVKRNIEDDVADPKEYLLNLAAKSRSRSLRESLLPEPGSAAPVGLGYNSKLGEFALGAWNPVEAAAASESLCRAIRRIESLGG